MEVDIDDLLDAYESNIHAAGKKYEGKFVKITYAHVCDIGTDSISFQGDGDAVFMHVVSKKINKEDKQVMSELYKVHTDDFVTVYGKIDGIYQNVGGVHDVSILIDHIDPTPLTADQLIQRAGNRAMKKLTK